MGQPRQQLAWISHFASHSQVHDQLTKEKRSGDVSGVVGIRSGAEAEVEVEVKVKVG